MKWKMVKNRHQNFLSGFHLLPYIQMMQQLCKNISVLKILGLKVLLTRKLSIELIIKSRLIMEKPKIRGTNITKIKIVKNSIIFQMTKLVSKSKETIMMRVSSMRQNWLYLLQINTNLEKTWTVKQLVKVKLKLRRRGWNALRSLECSKAPEMLICVLHSIKMVFSFLLNGIGPRIRLLEILECQLFLMDFGVQAELNSYVLERISSEMTKSKPLQR